MMRPLVSDWDHLTHACHCTTTSRPAAATQMRVGVSQAMQPEVFLCQMTFLHNFPYLQAHIVLLKCRNMVQCVDVDDVTVRRPSRVCFDVCHSSSPAAATCKPTSPAVQLRSNPVPSSSATVTSITPIDAQPSSVQQLDSMVLSRGTCGGGEVPSAVSDAGSGLHPYLVELIRTTIKDELEVVEERLHRDVISMHMDMLIRIDALQVCHFCYLVRLTGFYF